MNLAFEYSSATFPLSWRGCKYSSHGVFWLGQAGRGAQIFEKRSITYTKFISSQKLQKIVVYFPVLFLLIHIGHMLSQ
jgi:hypothetical protein